MDTVGICTTSYLLAWPACLFVTPRFPSGQATYVRAHVTGYVLGLDKLKAIKPVIHSGISYRMHLDRPVGTVYGNSRTGILSGKLRRRIGSGYLSDASGPSTGNRTTSRGLVHGKRWRRLDSARLGTPFPPPPSPPPRLLPSLVQLPTVSQGEIVVKLGSVSVYVLT